MRVLYSVLLQIFSKIFQSIGIGSNMNEENLYKLFCDEPAGTRLSLKARRKMDFEDKDLLFNYHLRSMLIKENQMFNWKGLPDTIPKRDLELQLQVHGYTIFIKHTDGKLYSLFGTLGGRFNQNYMPTIAIISNPYLKLNKHTFTINEDCVVIPNDTLYLGLIPLNRYYATQLIENDQSINCALINARLTDLLTARGEDEKKSLEELIEARKNGKIAVAYDSDLLHDKGIDTLPLGERSSQTLVQLIEHKQYTKGSFWNEIGVQSNYNMKRETITSNENILNVDSLLPLIDDMKEKRDLGIKKLKEVFGDLAKDISVDFSSSWKKMRDEISVKEKIDEREITNSNQMENKGDNNANQE